MIEVQRGAAALLAGLALAACGGAPAAAAPAAPPPPIPSQSAVATSSVDIANFAFSPAVITVAAGSTVTWINRDEDAHTVAIKGLPPSRPLQNGDMFSQRFDRAGSFSYICSIHPNMHGLVVVR